jgi:nucleotide-binding universal stress UspA family protein
MKKTILVPTDFSKAAANATEYAINLANDLQANVLLLYVYNLPLMPYTEVPVVFPMPQELQQDAEQQLDILVKKFKKTSDVEISFKAVMGLPVSEIEQFGKEADFIVMGMKDSGKISEFLIGSVTTAVIKNTATPVFVIPEHVIYKKPLKTVLATDYNIKTNDKAFDPLKQLVKLFNSQLFIVNIKMEQEDLMENVIAEGRIEDKFSDVDPLYYFPEKENLVEGINEFIRNKQADLLAIVPHRYNWIEGLFHRRNSKKIAFHTDIPLLALPEIA